MTRLKLLPTLVATLLLGLGACAPESDNAPEEPTLSLSSTAVTIPNAGGSAEAIAVTTNQSKWNAISNAAWVTTGVSGNSLTITAAPNPDGADRSAEVLVVAGATSAKISVIQTAADIVLEVSPDSIVVTNTGETKLVRVKSNSAAWTLEIDEAAASWISQTAFSDFVQLEIAPNEGEAREAKLYAKSGTTQKEIVITQAGTSLTPFFLPLLVPDAGQLELLAHEVEENGGYLLSYTAPDPGLPEWGLPASGAMYVFATTSTFFPTVYYLYDYDFGTLSIAEMVGNTGVSIEEIVAAGFVDFLKANGVPDATFDATSKRLTGTHEESGFTLLGGDTEEGQCVVDFTAPDPEQPEPYPTLDEFPLDHSFMLGDSTYNAAKIKELEAADGSVLINAPVSAADSTLFESLTYEVSPELAPLHTRLYFLTDADRNPVNMPTELLVIWSDPHVGAWEAKEGTFLLTAEFKALLEGAGFEFYTESNGNDYYYNAELKLMVVPRGARFSDVLDGAPCFGMNYFPYDVDAAAASVSERRDAVKALAARIAKQDKALGAQ